MPKGIYTRCKVIEFDMLMPGCKHKAFANCHIDEPYYDLHYEIAGMKSVPVPLCKSHYDWIHRTDDYLFMDYYEWASNDR